MYLKRRDVALGAQPAITGLKYAQCTRLENCYYD